MSSSSQALDIWSAIDRFFTLNDQLSSTNDLDAALIQLSRDVDMKQCEIADIIRALVDYDFRLFEVVLVSPGLGTNIQGYLIQSISVSSGSLPEPHLTVLRGLSMTITTLSGTQQVSKDILRLGDIISDIGKALTTINTLGRKRSSSKSASSPTQQRRKSSVVDEEAIFHKLGVSHPGSIDEGKKVADVLCKRLTNAMKSYLDHISHRSASSVLRAMFLHSFQSGNICQSAQHPILSDAHHSAGMGDVLPFLGDTVEPGRWLVVLAQRALRNLRQWSTKRQILYEAFTRKIEELSEGIFTSKNHAQFLDSKFKIPLYAAELSEGICIIYQIDCGGPATNPDEESQFIRVYDVDIIDKAYWRRIAAQLHIRDPEYGRRCNARSSSRRRLFSQDTTVPLTFERIRTNIGDFKSAPGKPQRTKGVDEDVPELDEDLRQLLEVPDGKSKDSEVFLEMHRVLALEKFIPHTRDLIDALQNDKEGTFMFAMSPAERDVIDHSSSCLVLGRSGTGKTTTMMFKMLAYELSSEHSGIPCRQMFVTQSPALAEKVKIYYDMLKQRSLDLAADQDAEDTDAPDFTFDDMDMGVRKGDTAFPEAWSKLEDHHFPLFLSYDELCNLLAHDVGQKYEPKQPSRLSYSMLSEYPKVKRGKITFAIFLSQIWPKLGPGRNIMDPLLLFNEIISVIEGSEAVLETELGYLNREAYLSLGNVGQRFFWGKRDIVYDLFDRYLRSKPKGTWDSAERSHALIKAMHKRYGTIPPTPRIDFIYVDEVQDNILLDTALLRWLCQNPHGLFFAGDTAQTVSAGSTFRFKDLQDFLYRMELRDEQVVKKKRKLVVPAFFSLSVNYRSHAGIMDMAAFVVDSLSRLFSQSVDQLEPENALVAGPKPMFFFGRGRETPFSNFLSGTSQEQQIPFGADQVIIVRDDAACEKLRVKLGEEYASLVMTIYLSKGQEFNDVLLYDFFADSPASAGDWEGLLKAYNPDRHTNLETFEHRHAVLQAELKNFYVGLTRARERVWVWDSSEKGDAFQTLMENRGFAVIAPPEQAPPPMAVRSSKRRWALRGKECFQREDYVNASLAFERANLLWWKAVTDGYEQKRRAEAMSDRDPLRLRTMKSAGDQLGKCVLKARTVKDKTRLLEISADCYLAAKAYRSAAEQLYHLDRYEESAWNYRLAGSFKEAIEILQKHGATISPKTTEKIKDVAAVVFSRQGETEMAKSLFETEDAHVEFLEDNGFVEEQVAVLVGLARHEAAAEALIQEGRTADAVKCLLECQSKAAAAKATRCLIEALFRHISFAADQHEWSEELSELMSLGLKVEATSMQRIELDTLKALYDRDLSRLKQYAEQHATARPYLSLLCLDAYLSLSYNESLGKGFTQIDNVIAALKTYVSYGRLIRHTANRPDLVTMEGLQRVFGLVTHSSSSTAGNTSSLTGIVVSPHSFIYKKAESDLSCGKGVKTDHGILLPPETAFHHVCQALLSRYNSLAGSLVDTLEAAKHTSPFTICVQHLDNGCTVRSCVRYHLSDSEMSVQGYNKRVEMHLLIVAAMECLNRDPGQTRGRKFLQQLWLQRLFEVCYPLDIRLGNISWVRPSLIPQYASLISAAKTWCEELYRTMRRTGQYFITNAIGCAMFGSAFDYINTTHYLNRAGWFRAYYKSEAHLRMQNGLLWFLRRAPSRHYHGVIFIQRAIRDKFQVDISTLISFTEEVVGHLVYNVFVLSKYEGREILLPTSWAIRACQQGSSPMVLGPAASILIESLSGLLEILRTGKGGDLHYRGRPIWDLPHSNKTSAIRKICQILVLVGQNLGRIELRREVLRHLANLRQSHGKSVIPSLYRSFAEAKLWPAALHALSPVSSITHTDPLLRILPNGNSQEASTSSSRLRVLRWTTDQQLLLDLNSQQSGLTSLPDKAEQSSKPVEDGASNLFEDDQQGTADNSLPEEHDADEEEAALLILKVYRLYKARSTGGLGGPLWEAYNATVNQIPDFSYASRIYRIRVRAAMPSILAHIRYLVRSMEEAKDEVNKRASSAPHEELDDIRAQSKLTRALLHDLKSLASRVGPDSSLYESFRLDVLRKEVEEIVTLKKRASALCKTLQTDLNFERGLQILNIQEPTSNPILRPVLNTSDLFF